MDERYRDIFGDSFVSHYQSQRPIDWTQQFGSAESSKPLEVEIGSGLGEFFVQTAHRHADRNFVGIEQDGERVKKILRKINRDLTDRGNVRVLQVDAVVAMERLFAPLTIDKVYCLFPCPWPKKRHIKHRLFSRDFFKLLNSRLTLKGEVQIVTDCLPYFDWMQKQLYGTGFKVAAKTIQPRFDTKYERKWCQDGHKEFYELALVKKKHRAVPLEKDARVKVYYVDHFDPERFHLPNVVGAVSIILKDFSFDPMRRKAMAHVVVAERSITQHLWIMVAECPLQRKDQSRLSCLFRQRPGQRRGQKPSPRGWRIAMTEEHTVLPTQGVALALQHVYKTIKKGNGIS